MLGQVRGSAGEVGERAGTYAGLAKPVREEVVENFEDVGGEGDDARGRRAGCGKTRGVLGGVFVGIPAGGLADKVRSESLWKS